MTEQWQDVEGAVEDTIEKIFDGAASILNLGIIYDKLPDDDRSLLIERLVEKANKHDMRSLDELIDKGVEPLRKLMEQMQEIIRHKRKLIDD